MNDLQVSTKVTTTSDILGAIASFVCLVHCLLTPVLFIAHTHAHDHHESGPIWWGVIDYLFLVISFVAISFSARKTSLKWMPYALYLSWTFLAGYILVEKFHLLHLAHEWIYLPAISLVFLHLYNRRHCNC
ncbi:MAG: MerC domain-containing protein [Bacteroidota bacterium]